MFKKNLFNHTGNPSGIASYREDHLVKGGVRSGFKVMGTCGSGQRFIMVSVSSVISKTFSFSSIPLFFPTCFSGVGEWVGGKSLAFFSMVCLREISFPFMQAFCLNSHKFQRRTCW